MRSNDLSAFEEAPFYFWAKDEQGVYVWANQQMDQYAGTQVAGKTDYDITSHDAASKLVADDELVFTSGEARTFFEEVDDPVKGKVRLSVCKYPGELDGKKCVFGVSFLVE